MQSNDRQIRQAMGCGYELPVENPRSVWAPPSGSYYGDAPTICAGYTTKLPEVREAVQAHAHWSKGSIVAYCGGEQPSEELLNAVLVIESSSNTVERWRMTPVAEGGGRE